MRRQVTIERTDNGFVSWGLDGTLVFRDPEPVHFLINDRDGLVWELSARVVKTREKVAE